MQLQVNRATRGSSAREANQPKSQVAKAQRTSWRSARKVLALRCGRPPRGSSSGRCGSSLRSRALIMTSRPRMSWGAGTRSGPPQGTTGEAPRPIEQSQQPNPVLQAARRSHPPCIHSGLNGVPRRLTRRERSDNLSMVEVVEHRFDLHRCLTQPHQEATLDLGFIPDIASRSLPGSPRELPIRKYPSCLASPPSALGSKIKDRSNGMTGSGIETHPSGFATAASERPWGAKASSPLGLRARRHAAPKDKVWPRRSEAILAQLRNALRTVTVMSLHEVLSAIAGAPLTQSVRKALTLHAVRAAMPSRVYRCASATDLRHGVDRL